MNNLEDDHAETWPYRGGISNDQCKWLRDNGFEYPPPAESWTEEAARIIGGNRADDYGEDTTVRIAAAWSAILGVEVTPRQFCWLMVVLKAIRDQHKAKRDNGVDAIGYLLLAERHD